MIVDPYQALADLLRSEARRIKAEIGEDILICIAAGGVPFRRMKQIGEFEGIRIMTPDLDSRL